VRPTQQKAEELKRLTMGTQSETTLSFFSEHGDP